MGEAAVTRRGAFALVLLLLCTLFAPATPAAADSGDFPDPFVLTVGGGYIAVGTSPAASDLNIGLRRSTNLRDWTRPVEALANIAEWALGTSVWAPAIASPSPGQWRLYYAIPHAVSGKRCISVAMATRPEGPYEDRSNAPLTCDDPRGGAIDPEVFDDDEGRQWLLWKTEGRDDDLVEAALWSQQLDAAGTGLLADRRLLLERQLDWERPLIENPSMVSDGGRLLLFYSAGVWQNETYKVGVARCRSPSGPCNRLFDGPVLASRTGVAGPGGASSFRDMSGRLRLAFHAWSPDRLGYKAGGARSMHISAVLGEDQITVGADPTGAFDEVRRVAPLTITARGWATDLDWHTSIDVHIYADGVGVAAVRADGARPDVEAVHPGFGSHRGWEATFDIPRDARQVCAYGINGGLGVNSLIGCRLVT
ncbi:MAG: glycoside hydrolase family 43 protein [Actinobacteria bacterium]|nr:glycoside hydrolase family 43 protein [Actinomycetota bacterium]